MILSFWGKAAQICKCAWTEGIHSMTEWESHVEMSTSHEYLMGQFARHRCSRLESKHAWEPAISMSGKGHSPLFHHPPAWVNVHPAHFMSPRMPLVKETVPEWVDNSARTVHVRGQEVSMYPSMGPLGHETKKNWPMDDRCPAIKYAW